MVRIEIFRNFADYYSPIKYMTLHIPFPELQSLLLTKAKQEVSLNYVDEQTVAIGKTAKFFGIEKKISMNMHVQEVAGSDIVLAHDNAILVKSIMEVVKIGFPQLTNLIEMRPPNAVAVHLDQIEQAKKALEYVTLNALCFRESGAVVDFSLRKEA